MSSRIFSKIKKAFDLLQQYKNMTDNINLEEQKQQHDDSIQFEELDSVSQPDSCSSIAKAHNQLRPDFKHLRLLLVVFLIEGMYYGYLQASLQNDLYKVGADNQSLGPLYIASFPYFLKVLWAPLVDTFFINKLGKRRSYLLLGLGLVALVTIAASFMIDTWISNLNIGKLTLVSSVIAFVLSFCDISADGWVVNYMQPQNTGYAGLVKVIGNSYGILISYNIYIGSDHLSPDDLFKFMGSAILLFCLYMALKVHERNDRKCQLNCRQLKKNCKRFSKVVNEHYTILGFLFLFNMGFSVIENVGQFRFFYIYKRLNRFIFSITFILFEINFIYIPTQQIYFNRTNKLVQMDEPYMIYLLLVIQLVFAVIAAYSCSNYGNHFTVFIVGYIMRLLNNVFLFYVLCQTQYIQLSINAYLTIQACYQSLILVPLYSYIYNIADNRVAGTFVTFFIFFSIFTSNILSFFKAHFSMFISQYISQILVFIIGFKTASILGLIFAVFIITLYFKTLLQLQKQQWD